VEGHLDSLTNTHNMNNVVFREISTVINRRYRALIWSSKEIKTIDLDLQLVNKISRNILSFLERSLGNSRDNLDVFEPYRVIKTINVNTNLNKKNIETLSYLSLLKILYTDLPVKISVEEKRLGKTLVCPSIYYYNSGYFKRIIGGCGGRVCDEECSTYKVEALPIIMGTEFDEDILTYEENIVEDSLDEIASVEDRLLTMFNINKLIYPDNSLGVLILRLKKSESEAVEVFIREGFDNVVIRLDLRKPSWDLNMFPKKIVSDIETLITNPIKKSYKYAPRGVLLVGPPGVGKSVLAEAIASEIGKKILDLKPSVYRSMWYGMTEKILEKLLKSITHRTDLALLIDDAEFLVSRALAIHEVHISEISILLKYLQNPDRPVTLLTSNTPTLIDQALLRPGRIDVIIVLGYPDRESRRTIIENILKQYDVKNVSEDLIEEIVRKTRWFNSAEIDALIRMALSKGDGRIDIESIEWARKRFKIDPNMRSAEHQFLRWGVNSLSNLVIQYIPDEQDM
jgi:adenylate kinase family enzyme